MAKQTGLFKFTGKLGNVIGYRRNGTHFFRSMPDKVRQTAATRQASRNFGISSRKGKLIRRAVHPYLDLRYDGTLVNRLNKALVLAGRDHPRGIEGFRFSPHTGIDRLFTLLPQRTADNKLRIPAQVLPKPGGATHLEVCVIAARIDFTEQRIVDVDTVTEIIDLHQPFPGMELALPANGKDTLVVTLQVRACVARNGVIYAMGDRKYMAADIVSIVPGVKMKKKQRMKTTMWGNFPVVDASLIAGRTGATWSDLPVMAGSSEGNCGAISTSLRGTKEQARGATRQSPGFQRIT